MTECGWLPRSLTGLSSSSPHYPMQNPSNPRILSSSSRLFIHSDHRLNSLSPLIFPHFFSLASSPIVHPSDPSTVDRHCRPPSAVSVFFPPSLFHAPVYRSIHGLVVVASKTTHEVSSPTSSYQFTDANITLGSVYHH